MSNGPRELSKRRALLLATIVYEYIQAAEPVGSQTLTQKYCLGVSPATIRSEMAELEAAGYLVQPHASAGRIPSDSGYRTYVDQLMEPVILDIDEQRRIRNEFLAASRELGELIESATRSLGRLTSSFAFAVAPAKRSAVFRHIQLIWLSARAGFAVVVTSLGVTAQRTFELRDSVTADDLTRLSNVFNATFGGKRLGQIKEAAIQRLVRDCGVSDELAAVVVATLAASRVDERNVVSSGTQHLLDQPEFHDLRKLRAILNVVEEQKALYDFVAEAMAMAKEAPVVRIGHELGKGDVSDCSVLAVPYRTSDEAVGMLALLGPRRMPYGRLLAILTGTAKSLTHRLAQL
jgi:heat-inducible transcriptional repressor